MIIKILTPRQLFSILSTVGALGTFIWYLPDIAVGLGICAIGLWTLVGLFMPSIDRYSVRTYTTIDTSMARARLKNLWIYGPLFWAWLCVIDPWMKDPFITPKIKETPDAKETPKKKEKHKRGDPSVF